MLGLRTLLTITACAAAALALAIPQPDDSVRITGETPSTTADGTDWLRRDVKRDDEEEDGSFEWRRVKTRGQ